MADPDQFTSVFGKHERQLYGFIASMLAHPSEAEDLLQETAKSAPQRKNSQLPKSHGFGSAGRTTNQG